MKRTLFPKASAAQSQSGKTGLTAAFSLVQAPYWMTYCVAVSFAAVYLQGLGYANARLGLILAAGSLLGAVLGPLLSARIDRSPQLTARLYPWLLAAQAATLLALVCRPYQGPVASWGFLLYIAVSTPVNSLNLKLYSDAVHAGRAIDYGFTRGIGSLGFVLVSVSLGFLVERLSVRVVPLAGLLICLLQLLSFLRFRRLAPAVRAGGGGDGPQSSSLPAFVAKNRRFCVLLLGTALMFFSHNAVGNFLINVVRNVGGDTGAMGVLNGFMAAMEIPMMLLYSRILRREGNLALRLAFVFFSLKACAIAAAVTIPQLAAAFVLQAPSFALYTAAIVPYVSRTVPHEDSAKAQSLAYTMTTVGSVLASLLAGRLYDALPVTATLWIAAGVCLAGSVISLLGTAGSAALRDRSLRQN